MRRLLPFALLLAACVASGPEPALRLGVPGLPAEIEDELCAAQATLQGSADSAAAWCDLGAAWLAAARSSLELEAVRRARASFVRARVLARGPDEARARRGEIEVALFRERREEALRFAEDAHARFPADAGLAAARIEALLANDRASEARSELDELARSSTPAPELSARVELALGRVDEAARILSAAPPPVEHASLAVPVPPASRARAAAVARAEAELAAVWLRAGKAREARAYLERAVDRARDVPVARRTLELVLAEAELATGDPARALERCERLRMEAASPLALMLAARAERKLGRTEEAGWHVHAAEDALRRAVDAGEVYALGPLANLEADAGEDLEAALDLARRWAQVAPRIEARALVERIELLRAQR